MAGVGWGPVASGQPQEQPDVQHEPVGVPRAWLCGAWSQHMPAPKGSHTCRKGHTCPPSPHLTQHTHTHTHTRTHARTHAMAPRAPGILSLECRPLPGSSGLGGPCRQHLLLGPWPCLWETVSAGSRVVGLLTREGPQAHSYQCETILPPPLTPLLWAQYPGPWRISRPSRASES